MEGIFQIQLISAKPAHAKKTDDPIKDHLSLHICSIEMQGLSLRRGFRIIV